MQIPWRLKSAAFSVLDRLPPQALRMARRMGRGTATRFDAIPEEWAAHREAVSGRARVLEFGAGHSLAQAIYLSSFVGEQVVVDREPLIDFAAVNAAIASLHGHPPVESLADLRRHYGIDYRAPYSMADLPAASFNAIASTNVLEHVPASELPPLLAQVRRVLKPGGIFSCAIDYSDHYSHTDRRIGPLNFLRFSEKQWARHNHRCHFQNRLRHGHFRALFDAAGLAGADSVTPDGLRGHFYYRLAVTVTVQEPKSTVLAPGGLSK